MNHPQQFEEHDAVLARVRKLCLGFPGADEKTSHGRPVFFTKKVFAIYGAVVKGDHHSGRYDQSVVFRPDPDEAPALEAHPNVFVPAYWGPFGWLGYDLGDSPDWDEVRELVEDSYRATAPKKLIAELDAV